MDNKLNIFEQQKQMNEMDKIMQDFAKSCIWNDTESILNDMKKQRNTAIAMAFTEQIGKLLKDNGVTLRFTEHVYDETNDDAFIEHYGVMFDSIDFSEHDKDFLSDIKCLSDQKWQLEREIEGLQEEIDRIKKLNDECCEENIRLNRENKELRQQIEETDLVGNLPYEPIEVAQMLITATHIYETSGLQRALGKGETDSYNIYDISGLRQIAEHLLVYCNNNKDEG